MYSGISLVLPELGRRLGSFLSPQVRTHTCDVAVILRQGRVSEQGLTRCARIATDRFGSEADDAQTEPRNPGVEKIRPTP